MAFGYLPPLASSLLFGGMYHSAAITCGSVSETMREAIRDVPLRCDHLRDRMSVGRVVDGGCEQIGPRQLAEALMQVPPAHHRPRNRDRQRPSARQRGHPMRNMYSKWSM